MAEHTALSVLLLSVFVFLFFKYCLGDNTIGEDLRFAAHGDKCPVGTVYSTHRQGCKELVMSPKSLAERMMLLMPYFLKGTEHPH